MLALQAPPHSPQPWPRCHLLTLWEEPGSSPGQIEVGADGFGRREFSNREQADCNKPGCRAGQGGGEGPTGSGCRRGGQLRSGADLSLVTVGFSWTLAKGFLGRGEKSHFSGFQERCCVLPCGCGQHQPPPPPPVSLPAQSWGWWRPRLQGQLSLSAPPSAPKPVLL